MQNQLLERDDFQFAPIIIPTLNRVNHLKRCIDSLSRCTWAEHTDIYISVDYPPSEKYEEGYKMVVEMLKSYDFSKFKSHQVFYQTRNLGPSGNFEFLTNELLKRNVKRYITTEDDNEFSPNFLEYINIGLETYESDENILAICGCAGVDWFHNPNENVVKAKLYAPYGVGTWMKKNQLMKVEGPRFLLDKANWTFLNFIHLFKTDKCLFIQYIADIICTRKGLYWKTPKKMNFCDTPMSIYMHLTNKSVVVPIISKSRTWGNDGSGVNMPASKDNGMTVIDTAAHFNYNTTDDFIFHKENYAVGDYFMNQCVTRKSLFLSILLCPLIVVLKNNTITRKILSNLH